MLLKLGGKMNRYAFSQVNNYFTLFPMESKLKRRAE